MSHVERPAFLDGRNTIWDQGDRAAWADEVPQVHHAELRELVDRFALFLASDDSRSVNGTALVADGGGWLSRPTRQISPLAAGLTGTAEFRSKPGK